MTDPDHPDPTAGEHNTPPPNGSGADEHERLLDELERELLGGQRRYTRREVAERAGMPPERTRNLWVAMGFPVADEDERMFTDGDVAAARMVDALVQAGAMAPNAELAMARTLGQTLGRLAEWQVRDLRAHLNELTEDPTESLRLGREVLPVIETLMSYVWRRHIAAAAGRMVEPTRNTETQVKTVGFADIVGYTTTTRHLDATELSTLLERFEEDAGEIVTTHHGQVVKQVGDEVMFTADRPGDAAEIGLAFCAPDRTERGLPRMRVGLASGPVLYRYGDVYGSVVNVAARLTSTARPESVLADAELARQLTDDDRFQLRSLRPISVRGYRHLRAWVLRPNTTG